MRPFLQRCQVGWFPMMLKRNFCEVVLEKKKYSGQCETVQCESFSFKKGLASGRPDVSSYWKKWSVSLSTPYIVSLRHGIICVAGQVGNDVFVGIWTPVSGCSCGVWYLLMCQTSLGAETIFHTPINTLKRSWRLKYNAIFLPTTSFYSDAAGEASAIPPSRTGRTRKNGLIPFLSTFSLVISARCYWLYWIKRKELLYFHIYYAQTESGAIILQKVEPLDLGRPVFDWVILKFTFFFKSQIMA